MKYSATDPYRTQIYSQSILRVMQEKVDFFKANSGMGSIDYNASFRSADYIKRKTADIMSEK